MKMSKIIDGKVISAAVKQKVADGVAELKEKGINVGLAVIIVGEDPASKVYVANKKKACEALGIVSEEYALPETTTEDELLALIDELNNKNFMIRQQGERIALNTPVQGSSADILKKAMIEIDRKFEELNLKSKMLLQIHDELVFNVCNDEVEIVKNIVKEIMESSVSLSVPLEVDMNLGNSLYEAK